MLADGPSRTSQVVALIRAGLIRPSSEHGDPEAQRELCAGMVPAGVGSFTADMAARTRFFDEQLLEALSGGIAQVVVLGAGFDDRAFRFRTPGVVFYEVDHPATQADKAERILAFQERAKSASSGPFGPVLVPADFSLDDLDAALNAVGHDGTSASVFICEGLLVYLDVLTIVSLLSSARKRAAPGSRLLASLATHREGISSELATEVANSRRFTAGSEPWRTILPEGEHLELLSGAGWEPDLTVDAAELDDRVEPGRSLLVRAGPSGLDAALRENP